VNFYDPSNGQGLTDLLSTRSMKTSFTHGSAPTDTNVEKIASATTASKDNTTMGIQNITTMNPLQPAPGGGSIVIKDSTKGESIERLDERIIENTTSLATTTTFPHKASDADKVSDLSAAVARKTAPPPVQITFLPEHMQASVSTFFFVVGTESTITERLQLC
jgi:hypothetical protein